jgi:oxygen-dependent protoporphyrinogen oxidase
VKSTIIVGAGISGLSAAYYLAKAGVSSTVLDVRPRLGGVIRTESVAGCILEGGPDSFLSAKPEAAALIKELGLESELIASNDHLRRTYIRKNGRLVPMPDGLMMMVPTKILPMVVTPLLGWSTKIRMGLEFLRQPAARPKDQSIAEFIDEHYGAEAVDYLAEPLLSGVYGGDPRELSVESVLPRFAELARRYGSLTRGVLMNRPKHPGPPAPLFRTLKGGLGQMVDAIAAAVRNRVDFRQARAETIERTSNGFRVRAGGDWMKAEHVVLACEAHNAGALLGGRLGELLRGIGYNSSVVVALGFNGPPPMNGFGFLVPRKERRQIVACTWVGTKFPYRVPAGTTLARCFLGGESEPSIESIAAELGDLAGFRATPKFHRVFRWPRAMAQYAVGHAQRIAEIDGLVAGLPGLHLAGNAYRGIGIPDCIRTGKEAAEKIVQAKVAAGPPGR